MSSSTSPSSFGSDNDYVLPPEGGQYIASGFAADVYRIDDTFVVKRPKFFAQYPVESQGYRDLVEREKEVYQRLGSHDGLLKYYGYDYITGAIKLEYAADGDLHDYILGQPSPPKEVCIEMIRRLSDAWLHIHCANVSIQDIKTENVLVQAGMPKVADFTQAILYPQGAENECSNDELRVDLLGIGCVIYSIVAWDVFDFEYFEEERWPCLEDLRPVDDMMLGDIISKCWLGSYSSIKEFHADVDRVLTLNTETA